MSNQHGVTVDNLLLTLPAVLREDDNTLAIATAIAGAITALSEQASLATIYANIDALPGELLDILAADYKVDWWDYDYTLEEKRETLKSSWYVHRRLGTKGAVERALSVIYPGSKVEEWFEYDGQPYHFRLVIPVDETTLDLTKHNTVLSLIKYYKNLRSVLDEIEYHGSSCLAIVYAAAAFAGAEITDGAIAVEY